MCCLVCGSLENQIGSVANTANNDCTGGPRSESCVVACAANHLVSLPDTDTATFTCMASGDASAWYFNGQLAVAGSGACLSGTRTRVVASFGMDF